MPKVTNDSTSHNIYTSLTQTQCSKRVVCGCHRYSIVFFIPIYISIWDIPKWQAIRVSSQRIRKTTRVCAVIDSPILGGMGRGGVDRGWFPEELFPSGSWFLWYGWFREFVNEASTSGWWLISVMEPSGLVVVAPYSPAQLYLYLRSCGSNALIERAVLMLLLLCSHISASTTNSTLNIIEGELLKSRELLKSQLLLV